jgi:hypothetical protein
VAHWFVEDFAVTFRSTSTALGLAVTLIMSGGVGGSRAQDETASSHQKPAAEQQAPADQSAAEKPQAEKSEEKVTCVTSNTAWREKGKSTTFEIELQNICDMKLKCTVDAFVTGARGQAQGHGTVVLAAAPKGQPTRNVYAMKVKSAGGMANISHSCKSI